MLQLRSEAPVYTALPPRGSRARWALVGWTDSDPWWLMYTLYKGVYLYLSMFIYRRKFRNLISDYIESCWQRRDGQMPPACCGGGARSMEESAAAPGFPPG